MMKKLMTALLAATALTASVGAEADTWSRPERLTAQGGLGFYRGGLGQVQAGADVSLYQVPFSPQFPLDLGASGRIAVADGGIAAGAYGTAHYSWKALRTGAQWLDGLEMYLGIGIGLLPLLGLDAYGGVSYHFAPRWAVFIEGAPFGGVLGASYRF